MQNLHVHKKSHIACFGNKVKNYNQHCFVAHIFKKTLFELFEFLDGQKCVLGPGDVFARFLSPKFHRFVYNMENVPQTLSDAPQKCFLCMFSSIWYMPFFKNNCKSFEIFVKGVSEKSWFFYWIAYWIAYMIHPPC